MLSNSLFLILSFLPLSSAFAASDSKSWKSPEESREKSVILRPLAQEREKTADEIIAELQNEPEHMSCQNWLSRNHPDGADFKPFKADLLQDWRRASFYARIRFLTFCKMSLKSEEVLFE